MGTNFYIVTPNPDTEDVFHPMLVRHLGKSSVGWAYMLRVWPEDDLVDLDGWVAFLRRTGGRIYDEYRNEHTLEGWLSVVRERWFVRDELPDEAFLRSNHAELCHHPEGGGRFLLFSEGFSDRSHGPTWEAVDSDFR
jgi:hypothetical protein